MSTFSQLADEIRAAATTLEQCERQQENESSEARSALSRLRATSYKLHQLTLSGPDWAHGFPYRAAELGTVRALIKLGVPAAIPQEAGASIPYSQLSSSLRFDRDVLERLCRFACTFGFLRETSTGELAHSTFSRLPPEHFAGFEWIIETQLHASLRTCEALSKDPAATEPNGSAFSSLYPRSDGSTPTVWEHYAENPDIRAKFASWMQLTAGSINGVGDSVSVLSAFDWSSLPKGATVVDVGGGRGYVMATLAAKYPSLKYIVQDKAEYADELKEMSEGAVQFMTYDFFTPQPVTADVFFFRRIFHDWSDKYCSVILSNTVTAMKPGSRLLINDIVLPESGGQEDWDEYVGRKLDMIMMTMANGKERSLSQWKALVHRVEPRLHFEASNGPDRNFILFTYK